MIREIPLTRGHVALVDEEDYERVMQFKWQIKPEGRTAYARTTFLPLGCRGPQIHVPMHRFILGAPDHVVVKHIDHNGLNNCRANLQLRHQIVEFVAGSDALRIQLTEEHSAVIDASDWPLLSGFSWFPHVHAKRKNLVYAEALTKTGMNGTRSVYRRLLMHRIILDAPDGIHVDHRDGNGLNNRRTNIRLATPAENARNRRLYKMSASGFRGVFPQKSGTWYAAICVNRTDLYLGTFPTAIEAALAYNEAARQYHGEFARLNQIQGACA